MANFQYNTLMVMDDRFEKELLALSTPLSFIDFETFSSALSPIPGTRPNDAIPCQWSNHILYSHGLDWDGQLYHDEYLWTGDWGFNPIYSFIETLYDSTATSNTILVYSNYEVTCLNRCIRIIENDIEAYEKGEIDDNYVVVTASGHKVPLMEVAYDTLNKINVIIGKIYDLLYGYGRQGGVYVNIQSPDLHSSNSIKYVGDLATESYSRSGELMMAFGLPANGYEGLRQEGVIAKGDDCTNLYCAALNRPPRAGVDIHEDGNAPFDQNIASQCLRYCCLDTLSMVMIYLAVLEETENYRIVNEHKVGQFIETPDGMYHSVYADGDRQCVVCVCDGSEIPWDEAYLVSQMTLDAMSPDEFFSRVCPDCRRSWKGDSW